MIGMEAAVTPAARVPFRFFLTGFFEYEIRFRRDELRFRSNENGVSCIRPWPVWGIVLPVRPEAGLFGAIDEKMAE